MLRIAKIGVFTSLLLQVLGFLIVFWRFGQSDVFADIAILVLLIGLMFKNPNRWVYAVAFMALLALFFGAAEWVLLPQRRSQFILLELLIAAVAAAAPICMIVAQRRSGDTPLARFSYGKLVLSTLLLLTVGILSQLTWRTWHAVYIAPMAMTEIVPPQWKMWVVDVSIDWQSNYGLWTLLSGLALIVVVGAHVSSKFFGARLYLTFYLSAIVAMSSGYLVATSS